MAEEFEHAPYKKGREIISIFVGNTGNKIGNAYQKLICQDHGINPAGEYMGFSDIQLMKSGVCFNETDGKYVPRAILVDLDPTSLDEIKNSGMGSLYNPDNFIQGEAGAGNNYAKAYIE